MRHVTAVLVLLVLSSPASAAIVTDSSERPAATGILADETTIEGVAIPVSADREARLLERGDVVASVFGVGERSNAFLLVRDGPNYVVYADRPPAIGRVSVTGTTVGVGGETVLFAERIADRGFTRSASITQLRRDAASIEYRPVRLASNLSRITYVDVDRGTRSVGVLEPAADREPLSADARWTVTTLPTANDTVRARTAADRIGQGPAVHAPPNRSGGRWRRGPATIRGVVLPSTERSAVEGVPPGEGLFVVATRVDDRGVRNTSVEALAANASAFRGATVRVNATIAGRELGVRGLLLRRSDCGAGVVRTDAGCTVRPGTDVTLHAGVLFNGTGRDDGTERGGANDTFRYATLSNRRIVGDTAPESGRYRVTGRVVQGARVRPNGTGDALRVHRLDRIGPGDAPEPVRRRGTAYADRVSDAIAGDTGTPTPTATPTDTPTASATPTSTTTATASATPTSTTTPTASATPTPTTTPTVARPTGAEPTVTGGGLGTVPGSAPGFGALAALVALLAAVAAGRYR